MILSVSNWFTNQKIAMIAAGMGFIGFIGPGLFDLPPPQYFAPLPLVVEHDDSVQEIKALSIISAERSAEFTEPLPEKTVEPLKEVLAPEAGLLSDMDGVGQNGQTDMSSITEKNREITSSENVITDDMAQLSQPAKLARSAKTSKGSNAAGVEPKTTVQAVRVTPILVPREFIKQIPASHQSLSGSAQKTSFFKIALPLILAGNEEVMRRREAIERANQKGDRANLEKWAHLYDVRITDQDDNTLTRQLLRRADVIPVPIALAQAAFESGWGTSRFAIKGNALFGQWAWRDDAGLRPLTPTNDRAVVRSFGTLSGSVRAYIHNLNTHPYYENFRNARAALYDGPMEKKTKVLVKHLDRYAAIGPVYVTKLENLIRTNDFGRYARAYLY